MSELTQSSNPCGPGTVGAAMPAPDPKEIKMMIDLLDDRISRAEVLVNELGMQLTPVMTSPPPELACQPEMDGKGTEFGSLLFMLQDRMTSLSDRLHDISSRLEI